MTDARRAGTFSPPSQLDLDGFTLRAWAVADTAPLRAASASGPTARSTARSRQLAHTDLRRTGRNVSLDSASADSTWSSSPGSPRTRARTDAPFGASRIALVANARRSSTP